MTQTSFRVFSMSCKVAPRSLFPDWASSERMSLIALSSMGESRSGAGSRRLGGAGSSSPTSSVNRRGSKARARPKSTTWARPS